MLALALQTRCFLLGAAFIGIVSRHGIKVFQALDGALHGGDVGEQAAEPALVNVELSGARRLFGDGFLRLTLGADKQNRLALRRHFTDVAHGVFEELECLLKIYDVDTVTFAKRHSSSSKTPCATSVKWR